MAELKNRFLYVSAEIWGGFTPEQKAAYNNSIVFVKNGTDGVSIYTQGAEFVMNDIDESAVRAIINSYGIAEGTNYAADKAALEAAIAKALTDAKAYTDEEVSTEKGRAEAKEAELNAAIATEKGRAEAAETALGERIDNIVAETKTYSIAKVEEGLGENVKEAFKLVDEDGAQVGETINIYKDSSLVSIELVDADKDGNAGQFLKYVYVLANGNQETVYVDANKFLVQSEFKNGLQVNTAGEVSVKVKEGETYLKVGADGVYTEGIDTAISTAVTTAVEALDANFENIDATGAGEGEVSVVSGVNLTQVDGKITTVTVNSAAAATKAYVDSKAAAATTTLKLGEGNESFLTLTEETVDTATQYTITINGVQTAIDTAVANLGSTEAEADKYITKIAVVDGKLTNEAAYVSNAKLVEFTTTSTDKYVGIAADDTINGAFDKVERAWDWAEITE